MSTTSLPNMMVARLSTPALPWVCSSGKAVTASGRQGGVSPSSSPALPPPPAVPPDVPPEPPPALAPAVPPETVPAEPALPPGVSPPLALPAAVEPPGFEPPLLTVLPPWPLTGGGLLAGAGSEEQAGPAQMAATAD